MSDQVLSVLSAHPGHLRVSGMPEGQDARMIAAAARLRGGVSMHVARDDAQSSTFVAALSFFDPGLAVARLPAWDCLPYDRVGPAPEVAATRLATLFRLAVRKPDDPPLLVVTTGAAMVQRVPPAATIRRSSFAARPGMDLDVDALQAYFAANGYVRAATVRERGEFAIRGGVIDLFAPSEPEPVRLDMFGDTLESIRGFDPQTQRSTRQLKAIDLAPVSEAILDEEAAQRFRRGYLEAFGAAQGDPLYEAVSHRVRRAGMEHWLPLFHDHMETVLDHVGLQALVLLDAHALDAARERLALVADYHEARQVPVPRGTPPYRALAPERLYLGDSELEGLLAGRDVRLLTPFAGDPSAGPMLDAGGRAGRSFAPERTQDSVNVWDAARQHVQELSARGVRPVLAAWSEGSAERLGHVLQEHGLASLFPLPNAGAIALMPKGAVGLAVLPLDRGFETGDLAVLSEADILGERLGRARKRRKTAQVVLELGGLSAGDLIVHIDHGIGRYDGLKTLTVQDAPHDCLELIYAGGDKLFLPVENIELVTRYGSEDTEAQLDKLGGAAWQNRKAKARKRLRDMAEGLIRIAAARAARETDAIVRPDALYDEFCARFPYEETEDQLASLDDIFADFASGHPMDRLICGDVGFGKTEVALRAAFVMAMSGRQVAVVCPTTLLARQHFRTFTERFRGWPVRVRQLSRMVGSKEAEETKKGLADGTVEIVVGTHALLSKDVKLRDAGLLIVDEEQHFGVKHKERLKEMRADTHVLTLSATPIPRTLQMALAGIREMSIIATPPVDRLAVRTYVTPWDPVTIREALLREKYRGGQAFIVVPRIDDLPEVERFLREQLPEMSFATAHGQMPPTTLEPIITGFYEGREDILLSTTIVESGLDIPRANTLVIWRSDMFGLAQLYQLRGRVGRSKTRAYAYLTVPAQQPITSGAEKRLKILQSLDSLGAGFMLASHDLDMRGGGNLLGEEQSGHIKEVGVELYQNMLEEAVASLKSGEEQVSTRSWSPSINLGVAVLIPEEYVPDLNVRLSLYRRLADLGSDAERDGWAAELIDRFGPMPEEVRQLIDIAGIKALCRAAGVAKIDAGPKGAVITFRPENAPDPVKVVGLVQKHPALFRLRPDAKLVVMGTWDKPDQRLRGARRAAEMLAAAVGG
jgi:transcription-repair coupling factor (superfamily II helicase)